MSYYTLWLIAFGLSMDTFAVAVTKGLTLMKFSWKLAIKTALCFGIFQAITPLVGYYIGLHFHHYIDEIDHWLAFALLFLIGIHMLKESFSDTDGDGSPSNFSLKHLCILGVATSIDAIAMGLSFAFLETNICVAVLLIGSITMAMSIIGVKAGHWLGVRVRKQAEFLGGFVLISIGIKIYSNIMCLVKKEIKNHRTFLLCFS